MAKEGKFWFDHDYHARNDDKILELRAEFGAEGYGVFWMIIETMADSEAASISYSRIGGLSHGYGVAKGRLSEIIDFCVSIGLFVKENGEISSQRVKNHKNYRKDISIKSKEAAEKRWGKLGAPVMPPHSNGNAAVMPTQSQPNAHNITLHNNSNTEAMTEKEFVEFSEKLKTDKLLLEPLYSSGLKPEHLDKWIIHYHVQIVGDGNINKDYREYKRHFKNWLVTKDYTNAPPKLTALEKIKATPNYIKAEKDVDFNKYK